MLGNGIHHVYIADGFMDDAEDLIQKCIQRQDILDFQSFCIVWKEMDLGCMYKGRSSGAEVAELSEEVLQIAKHYMLANTSNYEESVAGLFLVYSLLNLQPYPGFAALRLIPEDVPAITRLETVARRDKRHDVLYILASVLIKGSHYAAAERERGMEAPIKKYLDGFRSIDSIRGVRPKGVFYRQNEELDIIRELGSLTKRYSDAKKQVIGSRPPDRSLQYMKEDLALELNCSLRKIISGIHDDDDDDNVSDIETIHNEENSPKEDHASIVESIKSRAMKETVNPMKHLLGIEDRRQQAKLKQQQLVNSDNKSNSGKVKTNSPTKSKSTPRKRRTSTRGNRNKKSKVIEASTSNMIVENKGNNQIHELYEEAKLSDDEEEAQIPINTVNLEIGYLPSLIRTDEAGKIVQIELIDNGNPQEGTKVDVIQLKSLPDLDSMDNQPVEGESSMSNQPLIELKDMTTVDGVNLTDAHAVEQQQFKRQRNRKKTHLKSKFKRMGILPVANFHDPV